MLAEWLQQWQQLPESQRINESTHSQLEQVWAGSEYVARLCLQRPQLLLAIEPELHRSIEDYLAPLQAQLAGIEDEAEIMRRLRLFRHQHMLRIIWRDLCRLAELEETLSDLSRLADACIQASLNWGYEHLAQRHGYPLDEQGQRQNLVVLGMGKLGAYELNLSSDIDLIFCFAQPGQTDGRRPLANEQFFTQLGRYLIRSLSQITAEGFVFRVDMRLRPFGKAGPLALSFEAMETYYEGQAREWERYAMIKARAITGNDAEKAAIAAILRPFVYRRYIDFGVIAAIREMKQKIEADKRGMERNIKLGRGGIREIEFIGQALQLVHGGRHPELQIRPILPVLQRLKQKHFLPEQAAVELSQAYVFLRLTENRIQAWRDEQTHLLPEDEAGQQRLARSMGFAQWADFKAVLDAHRQRVEHHFAQIFISEEPEDSPWRAAWLALNENPQALTELMQKAGYAQAQKLQDWFLSLPVISANARRKLDQLMPKLLPLLAEEGQPDLGLERLLSLLQSILKRSAYLDLLLENQQVLRHLAKLATHSQWIVDLLSHYPVLLDELIDPRRLYAPLNKEELKQELDLMLQQIPAEDLEQQMERLRQFAAGNRLRVAAADITEVIPLTRVSDYLSDIAEVVLDAVLQLAWRDLSQKYGCPSGVQGRGFVIIAYGKLGGRELSYSSDLDLVFLHEPFSVHAMTDGAKSVSNAVFYARLAQRMIHLLQTRTPSGILYEIDMRLRPNGAAGLLVSSLKAFEQYQQSSAWTWEHQALIRARAIVGETDLMKEFAAIRQRILCQERHETELKQAVRQMRLKMRQSLDKSQGDQFDIKQGEGGLTDIEFMVQYEVLRWAAAYPQLAQWTDNLCLLQELKQCGLFSAEDSDFLTTSYQQLRQYQHRLALQQQPALITNSPEIQAMRQRIQALWQSLLNGQ